MTDAANEAVDAAQPVSTNLSNQAHQAISEMIQRRRLRGGEVIVEARLAEVLNISRTPLREALQRLEGEGLVIKGTGRSFMVRHVDLREYLQSLKVREILEPEAATLAVGRIPRSQLAEARQEIVELRPRRLTTPKIIGAPTIICTDCLLIIAETRCSGKSSETCASRLGYSRSPALPTGSSRIRPNTSRSSMRWNRMTLRLRDAPLRPTSAASPVSLSTPSAKPAVKLHAAMHSKSCGECL